jgi:hypothetical protein
MEAYAWACGLPHTDFPPCVPHALSRLFQNINDWSGWKDDADRTAWLLPQMTRLANAGIGVPNAAMERRIAWALTDYAIRVVAPEALEIAGMAMDKAGLSVHGDKLREHAGKLKTLPEVDAAAAAAARYAAAAADAADAAAAYAAAYAARKKSAEEARVKMRKECADIVRQICPMNFD